MKIATFNVNGVNGRLPVLLRWLKETSPDVVCLQELKSETFPQAAVRAAGYEAIWQGERSWNGVAILTRGKALVETRRALPGDEDDTASRYIEAAVDGLLIGCLYLPNGNPAQSEKFGFKLRWFERLIAHAAELLSTGAPIVLAGDYNVMPTELDVYKPERWVNDARSASRSAKIFAGLSRRAGPMRSERFIRESASTPSGIISETPMRETPDCASTTCS
jgi:exodeoxyribonuclease-3